ncbi:hypothetical protein QBC34DRAFT_443900 [Podospora aff. communis PSN243]|uniref:NAD-dependent epimerase/dehydratase domain-containing protein n=1 Tax=Podospora aff. communis PSN243 TaxID=3040156 RepID=A0AAV9G672_9PEZI|nr:hypothetical protein QBC34DRAFT_443900 [Podospora aff. communis PSN243]
MSPTPAIPKGALVLITGINGYLASELALHLLTLGYRVRGTVRALPKATWLTTSLLKPHHDSGAFSVIEVPQIDTPDAFSSAIKDVSAVFHLATFGFGVDPNDIIPREVAAIRSFLTTAKNEPSVRRFVLTSSIVAAATYTPTSTEHVTAASWNETAVKAAWAPPPYDASRLMPVYSASKVAAEKEFWRFHEEEKPGFVMNAVLPQSIVGRRLNKNSESVSAALIPDLFAGRTAVHDSMIPAMSAADVRDVALLHVAAALDTELDGKRIYAWGRPMTWNDVLAILRKNFPDKTFTGPRDPSIGYHLTADLDLELSLLKKWGGQDDWTSLEKIVMDNLEGVVDN